MRELFIGAELDAFRETARRLISAAVAPTEVHLLTEHETQLTLLPSGDLDLPPPASDLRVPRAFGDPLEWAAAHRPRDRWDLLYRLLWRLSRGERNLLELNSDPDVLELGRRVRAVKQDLHHATAFLRFTRVERDGDERYIGWHRPDHRVLPKLADFFVRRFPSMPWSILTPDGTATWDGSALAFGPGVDRDGAPTQDELVELWRTYYAAAFNPARANPRLLQQKLPSRFMANLPEATVIPSLLHQARATTQGLLTPRVEFSASSEFLPADRSLPSLARAASRCIACPIADRATQTVFGAGPASARLMLVGEQPGDQEDRQGMPFIGPAGRVLDEALEEAGLDRRQLYMTNAVKHFHHTLGSDGRQRIHQRPGRKEVLACKGWLEAEIASVQPQMILCLGATAAQSFFGGRFSIAQNRGQVFQTPWAEGWMATYHPSAILRAPDEAAGRTLRETLVADLRAAAQHLRQLDAGAARRQDGRPPV